MDIEEAPSIGLSEAVRAVRSELETAIASAPEGLVRLEVTKIDMEFAVELHSEGTAKVGARFWVVETGADYKRGSSTAHRVRVELTPTSPTGGSTFINDRDR